jgi:phosphate transport system protein
MDGRTHLLEGLSELHQLILRMGSQVEEAMHKAISAVSTRNFELASEVVEADQKIDGLQASIEDMCTRIIATEQPVASDLRDILTSMKFAGDLERIGDHARHVAAAVESLSEPLYAEVVPGLAKMAEAGTSMLHDALTCFVQQNADGAEEVARRDDEIDRLHHEVYELLVSIMRNNPESIPHAMHIMFINRFMERLGDHVTNMCEWVVFLKRGKHVELNP